MQRQGVLHVTLSLRAPLGISLPPTVQQERPPSKGASDLRVLDYDVLVGDESIYTIVPAFPPVIRSSLVKQQGCSLLERQFSGCPAYVVKLGNGFYGLTFWEGWERMKRMFLGSTDSGNWAKSLLTVVGG